MNIFGLHFIDWLVLLAYFVAMIWIGRRASARIHKQADFFLAGRTLGKLFQFFLNFGNMTDASGAVRTSSIVYNQGVGGVWLVFQTLFMTPYYWFMTAWFRRTRLTTVADIFPDRFGGKFLAVLYAVLAIFVNVVSIGGGYLVTYKVLEIFIVKPESAYTLAEKGMITEFREFSVLNERYSEGRLADSERERFEYLKRLQERGEVRSYVSYVHPLAVCLLFAVVVGAYVIMGGMAAAALTDAFQGIMIVVFSVILIPFGLWHLGGLRAFQEKIPDRLLDLFGSGVSTEFTWYSVGAILLLSMVQIHGVAGNMAIAGSARDETAAATGAVSGGFLKRIMIIAWCFCGLIAFAMFGGGLSDPDAVWGTLCRTLLGPGFLGLMLVGLISAEMAGLSAQCLTLSALFVRNVYLVIWPHKTEKEGLTMARVLVGLSLFVSIGVAFSINDLLAYAKMQLTLNVAFGAAILVIFKWRRVTKAAVTVAVLATLFVNVVIPFLVPMVPAWRSHPSLQARTAEKVQIHAVRAHADDVREGRASQIGERVEKRHVIPPKSIFFDRVVADDPKDPHSDTHGQGRFHFELFLLALAGMDLAKLVPAQLLTAIYVFDSILPFILLFGISLLTFRKAPAAEPFYVKMRTPVIGDPDADARQLEAHLAEPSQTVKRQLFPGSAWEFHRWGKRDAVAFGTCCLIALAIFGFFAGLLQIGRL